MRGMRAFCIGFLSVVLFAAVAQGCSTFERLGDSPVVVRLAVSQAVLRYIESGDTAVDAEERRAEVLAVMSNTLGYIDVGASATVDNVVEVFVSQINLNSMTVADQLLARETILLVRNNLHRRVLDGELPADTVLALRSIVQTAIDTAHYL